MSQYEDTKKLLDELKTDFNNINARIIVSIDRFQNGLKQLQDKVNPMPQKVTKTVPKIDLNDSSNMESDSIDFIPIQTNDQTNDQPEINKEFTNDAKEYLNGITPLIDSTGSKQILCIFYVPNNCNKLSTKKVYLCYVKDWFRKLSRHIKRLDDYDIKYIFQPKANYNFCFNVKANHKITNNIYLSKNLSTITDDNLRDNTFRFFCREIGYLFE